MPINTNPKISEDLNKEKRENKKVSFEPIKPKYSFEEVILNGVYPGFPIKPVISD